MTLQAELSPSLTRPLLCDTITQTKDLWRRMCVDCFSSSSALFVPLDFKAAAAARLKLETVFKRALRAAERREGGGMEAAA